MANQQILNKLRKNSFGPKKSFLLPNYNNYSFANIHSTILHLLTQEKSAPLLPPKCFGGKYPKIDRVVLFLIDALGFLSLKQILQNSKATRKIFTNGTITPISAVFPSTTSASLATLCSGALPKEHGLYEWQVYFEEYDETILTLPFSPVGKREGDACLKLGFSPKHLFQEKTIYEKLKNHKVESTTFVRKSYSSSSFSRLTNKGAKVIPFKTLPEALTNLRVELESNKKKSFYYLYWDAIDSIGHSYGPSSPQFLAEAENFWLTLEKELFEKLKKDEKTLFMFTADHGQTSIYPEKTFYLNQKATKIKKYLKQTKNGHLIYPNGGPRDVFLHIKDEFIEEACAYLKKKLDGIAEVYLIKDALKKDLFGPPPYSQKFIKRIGNILILPLEGEVVWWYEKNKLEVKHKGHHGGLTPEEMLTFIAVR